MCTQHTHVLIVDEDFASISWNVTFLEVEYMKCLEIPIFDDSSVSEGDEQFMVTFTVLTPGVESGVPNVSYVTIIDNDGMCTLSDHSNKTRTLLYPSILFQCLHLNPVTLQVCAHCLQYKCYYNCSKYKLSSQITVQF